MKRKFYKDVDEIVYYTTEPISRVVDPTATTLKIGVGFGGTNFLNGYLYKLVYYPTKCNEKQVKFLLGVQ